MIDHYTYYVTKNSSVIKPGSLAYMAQIQTRKPTPEELAEMVYKESNDEHLARAVRNYAYWLDELIRPSILYRTIKERLFHALYELINEYDIKRVECEPVMDYIVRLVKSMDDEEAQMWFNKIVDIVQRTYAKLPEVAEAVRSWVLATDDKYTFGFDRLEQIQGELYEDFAKILCQMRGYNSNELQFGRPKHIRCV